MSFKDSLRGAADGFDNIDENRAAAERALAEQQELRQLQLLSQSEAGKAPDERIKVWEQLHGLDLPRRPSHKLVLLIAAQTQLTVADVIAEQRRRAERRAL